MGSLDLEVGFWRRGLEIAEQFSADEMANSFIKAFNGQSLAWINSSFLITMDIISKLLLKA